jgi:Mce-associated membrane protein
VTRRTSAVAAALLVTTLVLAVLGWRAVAEHRRNDQRQAADAAAVAVARDQVLGLTTLDYRKVDAQVATMVARTTGDFRKQFQLMTKTFEQVVTESKVTAVGKVLAAGVSKRTPDSAQVIVASEATVRNSAAAKATDRTYRMRVTLQRHHGDWLVSNMEFVP